MRGHHFHFSGVDIKSIWTRRSSGLCSPPILWYLSDYKTVFVSNVSAFTSVCVYLITETGICTVSDLHNQRLRIGKRSRKPEFTLIGNCRKYLCIFRLKKTRYAQTVRQQHSLCARSANCMAAYARTQSCGPCTALTWTSSRSLSLFLEAGLKNIFASNWILGNPGSICAEKYYPEAVNVLHCIKSLSVFFS